MGGGKSKPEVPNPEKVDLTHFTIGRTLGRGGFGVVKAIRKKTEPFKDAWYAMKTLSKTSIVEKHSFEEVFREVRLLQTLHHRFICNAHFAFQDKRNLYLVMDCAMGGDLRYHMKHWTPSGEIASDSPQQTPSRRRSSTGGFRRKSSSLDRKNTKIPLGPVRGRWYLYQMLHGLKYLHNRGILHRDIKPENVLMLPTGYVKMTDFGLSYECGAGEPLTCKESSGTPSYMAPEIYTKSHEHGPCADFFALGVMLHEFLFFTRPYERDSFHNTDKVTTTRFMSVQGQKFSPIRLHIDKKKKLSDDTKDLLKGLLRVKPANRIGASGGAQEILDHPFFDLYASEGDSIQDGTKRAPWIPDQAGENNTYIEVDVSILL